MVKGSLICFSVQNDDGSALVRGVKVQWPPGARFRRKTAYEATGTSIDHIEGSKLVEGTFC